MKTLKTLIILCFVTSSLTSCIDESDFETSNQNPDEIVLKDGTASPDSSSNNSETDGDIGGDGGSGTHD